MRSIIQDRKKRNFAFMALNFSPEHDLMICSCCKCCCHLLDAVNNYGAMIAIAPPMYIVDFDASLCTHRGTCVNVCPANAHVDENNNHVLDKSKCIGCGVCAENCPDGALKMVKNPSYTTPYRSIAELGVHLLPRIIRMSIKIKGQVSGRAAKK
jgi:Pyruvate/2-oxoacid:ferredoxin oxidoreductase delta subunit